MVSYSFQKRFVRPIRVGLGSDDIYPMSPDPAPKRQTIRADRERHARSGEELQLYCGMRTKARFLIGRSTCVGVVPITLMLKSGRVTIWENEPVVHHTGAELDAFARLDGFNGWADMREFWSIAHPALDEFNGVLITWRPK